MVVITDQLTPTEGVVHQEDSTNAVVQDKDLGGGTLYIAEGAVVWRSNDGQGFTLNYKDISVHAVSRDVNTFPRECLYLMLEGMDEMEPANPEDEETSSDGYVEIRFVPACRENLDSIYKAMCACQELHPDPVQDDPEEDWYGEENIGEGDGVHLSEEGMNNLNRFHDMLANQGENQANGHNGEGMEQGQYDDVETNEDNSMQ